MNWYRQFIRNRSARIFGMVDMAQLLSSKSPNITKENKSNVRLDARYIL
jgi:hypothetical protein